MKSYNELCNPKGKGLSNDMLEEAIILICYLKRKNTRTRGEVSAYSINLRLKMKIKYYTILKRPTMSFNANQVSSSFSPKTSRGHWMQESELAKVENNFSAASNNKKS